MSRRVLGSVLAALVTASVFATAPTGASANADRASTTSPASTDKKPRDLARESARNLIESRSPRLRVGAGDGFRAGRIWSTPEGLQYASYERTYRGLPVHGGDFVVVTDRQGRVLDTSVAQRHRIGDLSVRPSVAASRAADAARALLDDARTRGRAELVVDATGKPRLAWRVRVSGTTGDRDHRHHSVEDVYVDARTGRVIDRVPLLHFGSGTGHHNGPNPLPLDTTRVSSSSYSMKDPNIAGLDCRDDAINAVYTGSDDNWGDGTGTSKETGCVDALFSLQTQDAMLHDWLGRSSFDGSGGGWEVRVGKDEINAFYCPPGLVEPGYCDGTEQVRIGHNQAGTKWLTNLDVMAHEYGHGIDQHTPGGHSRGGTSEFVGDVFGALTEAYADQSSAYDPPDYTVGEEVNLVGQGPIRTMYNPSVNGDPNCYSSSIPNTEVHAAAGPGNHWFYLLAEGTNPSGKPSSPTCNGATNLTGIGIRDAGRIFYNAMLMKTSSSSYLKYRTWTLTAAKNLFPGDCTRFDKVKAAWDAVNVPAQAADPTCTTGGGGGGSQLLQNPGFESGATGWSGTTGVISTATGSQSPRSGSRFAYFGGNGRSSTENLTQTVTIPASAASATLTFWVRITTAESTTSRAYDTLRVQVVDGGTTSTRATYSNLDKSSSYVQKTVDLTAYKGRTISVRFLMNEDVSLQTTFATDDTALTIH